MSHHKVEAKNLTFTYPDGTAAVQDLSFMLRHGESVGLLGANGAGKSTLLLLLTGVLTPQEGEIIVGDVKMTRKTLPHIRQRLGLIFQHPDDQLFNVTIYDDVAFGPRNEGLDEIQVEQRVMSALKSVNAEHLKDKSPLRCSGGEKRAAAIASVLSMQPDVLILDEPTSELDPKSRRNAINLLKGFTHTKIIASHDIDMIYEVCERVIIINEGKIAADGKTADIVKDANFMDKCGLEIPLFMQKIVTS